MRYATVDELVVAYSGNLSRGGLFLATSKVLPLGSIVAVQIELPDGAEELSVPCKVAFVRAPEEAKRIGKPPGMGVKFVDPDDTTRKRLEWFILNSAPEPGQLESPARARPLDIVIVDDDPLQAQAAAAPFLARKDEVRRAGDGLEGLTLCLKSRPDIILSDVEMPRMDGWQFLRLVRARPALASVPVIFLTALSGENDRLNGYRLGVDDYIPKPPDPKELVVRVERAVVRAEQQRHLGSALAETNALRGDLEQVSLGSVLAFLELERRTGLLRIGPHTNGRVYVLDGRPVATELDGAKAPASSVDRFHQLLDVRSGRFDFVAGPVSREDEIKASTTNLLLEHARRSDETSR